MGKLYPELTDSLRTFCQAQPLFFVATAPLSSTGHVNLSPKGQSGTFGFLPVSALPASLTRRSPPPKAVFAFLDLGGSGLETVAHLRGNGRVVVMFMATAPGSSPKIVRLHGRGTWLEKGEVGWSDVMTSGAFGKGALGLFEEEKVRNVVLVFVDRISDSCGYGVPFLEWQSDRTIIPERYRGDTAESMWDRRRTRFSPTSIDGLCTLRSFDRGLSAPKRLYNTLRTFVSSRSPMVSFASGIALGAFVAIAVTNQHSAAVAQISASALRGLVD